MDGPRPPAAISDFISCVIKFKPSMMRGISNSTIIFRYKP